MVHECDSAGKQCSEIKAQRGSRTFRKALGRRTGDVAVFANITESAIQGVYLRTLLRPLFSPVSNIIATLMP